MSGFSHAAGRNAATHLTEARQLQRALTAVAAETADFGRLLDLGVLSDGEQNQWAALAARAATLAEALAKTLARASAARDTARALRE